MNRNWARIFTDRHNGSILDKNLLLAFKTNGKIILFFVCQAFRPIITWDMATKYSFFEKFTAFTAYSREQPKGEYYYKNGFI